jgi:hypothetical protein
VAVLRQGRVGDFGIDQVTPEGDSNPHGYGGSQTRQEWIRANFAQIFGTSAADLHAQGIDPRQYAREHRDQIRRFAQMQRSQGIAVPDGRAAGGNGPGGNGPGGGPGGGGPVNRRYGYGMGGRYGMGFRGGGAWIGILLALFALRFLLVDSFAGTHAAIFWVIGIGGIMLVARVFLFSWLRRRRRDRRQ